MPMQNPFSNQWMILGRLGFFILELPLWRVANVDICRCNRGQSWTAIEFSICPPLLNSCATLVYMPKMDDYIDSLLAELYNEKAVSPNEVPTVAPLPTAEISNDISNEKDAPSTDVLSAAPKPTVELSSKNAVPPATVALLPVGVPKEQVRLQCPVCYSVQDAYAIHAL